ncbi:MAG: hypothetical protein GF328_12485 [Candidatus Latescibacteria bacterium]|nr:hypothetical protein [Candidatus Latescibacterota bacterium]
MVRNALVAAFLLAVFAVGAAAEEEPIWLAVGPEELLEEIEPLADFRRAEGLEVRRAPLPVGAAIRDLPRPPSFILLVGDDLEEPGEKPWRVPGRRLRQYRWSSFQEPEFVSDAVFGDLDGDRVPDVPVGRIPARTPKEASAAARKILAFERGFSEPEDLRILACAGRSGYGKALDAMATGLLADTLRRFAPRWAGRYLLTAQVGHPLCGWPPDQPAVFNREYRRGAVLAAFVAHASKRAVGLVNFRKERVRYRAEHAARDLAGAEPGPPLVILACLAGSYANERPCLAESLLGLPGGPVAVVAASAESHPIPNYYSGKGLLGALSGGARRVGDLWLDACDRARGMREILVERVLKDVETSVPYEIEVPKLMRDQEVLYALFGDPATRLRLPLPLKATVERAEEGWRWSVARRAGDVSLTVSLRPLARRSRPEIVEPEDRAAAEARLSAANRAGAFRRLSKLDREAEWRGLVKERGWLRLVVRGSGGLRVFTRRLR